MNYFGINILYLYDVFSWLSAALTVAIIPLLAVTVIVAMLKLTAVVKSRPDHMRYVFKSSRKKPINVGVYEEFPVLDDALSKR